MNYNRMTIRVDGETCRVFKMNPNYARTGTGGGRNPCSWRVQPYASARFVGTYGECLTFIAEQGAEYMTEHGIPA